MAIEMLEVQTSPVVTWSYNSPSAELEYVVTGTIDEADVDAKIQATIVDTFFGMSLKGYNFSPVAGELPNGIVGIWIVKVKYERVANRIEVTFDTTGATQKRFVSLETDAYRVDEDTDELAPDYSHVIGVKDDGTAEGVDIVKSCFKFTINVTLEFGSLSADYLDQLEDLTGTVNDEEVTLSWNGFDKKFAAGELLFLGGQVSQSSDLSMKLTLRFEKRKNREDIEIGVRNDIVAAGHDYIWTKTRATRDTTAFAMVPQPWAAYVEKVYPRSFLGALEVFS